MMWASWETQVQKTAGFLNESSSRTIALGSLLAGIILHAGTVSEVRSGSGAATFSDRWETAPRSVLWRHTAFFASILW